MLCIPKRLEPCAAVVNSVEVLLHLIPTSSQLLHLHFYLACDFRSGVVHGMQLCGKVLSFAGFETWVAA